MWVLSFYLCWNPSQVLTFHIAYASRLRTKVKDTCISESLGEFIKKYSSLVSFKTHRIRIFQGRAKAFCGGSFVVRMTPGCPDRVKIFLSVSVRVFLNEISIWISCCSVAQLCPTLCDPMNYSTAGFPIIHHLPGFAQTHVHWVSDAIQAFRPVSSPSAPAFHLSQHQGLFQ